MPLGDPRVLLHNKSTGGSEEHPIRIHLVQKNAHSAQANAFMKAHHMKKTTRDFASTPSDDDRMMVVRHPADRAVSAWAFFCWKNPDGNLHDFMQALGYRKQMEWDRFYEVWKNEFRKDIHTRPQVEFTCGWEIDHLVPIESLDDWWAEHASIYMLPQLEITNRSNHAPWQEVVSLEQREEIESLLKEDLELYNKSKHTPTGGKV